MLNKVWRKDLPTAGVSKHNINYQLAINEEFWNGLSDDHKMGLLKHELLHIAFGHLVSFSSFSNKKLANVAMDMEINQYIDCSWLPGGDLTSDQFNQIKETVKAELEQAKANNATPEELLAINKKLPPRGIMIDDYADLNLDRKAGCRYYYDQLLRLQDEKDKNGTTGDQAMDDLLDSIENGDIPDHSTWEEFDDMSDAEKDNPGLKIKMRQHMLLAIDTSGSVSNDELAEFMNEIHHIHKAGVDITIVQCDTSIRSIEPYKGKNDLKVHGRGGTEFDPVLDYYNANIGKYTSLVYFTDGECYTSVKPKNRVLWVLSERSHMNEDLPGQVIKLEL